MGDTFLANLAFCFAFAACASSIYLIGQHLKNYNAPDLQRYIVRILWMVPVGFSRLLVLCAAE